MKIKIKKIRKNLEKHRIIILLIPIFLLLTISYTISKSFLAEGQVNHISNEEFEVEKFNDFACGNVDSDGKDEIVVAQNDNIKVYDNKGELLEKQENVFREKGDYKIALGDINGDGRDEIVKYLEEDRSTIEVYNHKKLLYKFAAFDGLRLGVSLALGDINNNGQDEIIVGAGKGGGPQVKVFEGAGREIASFFVFNPPLRSGINVASGNVDEEEGEEVIVSEKSEGEGVVRVYKMDNLRTFLNTFMAYPNTFKDGARIIASDLDGNNKSEIVTYKEVDSNEIDLKMFDALGGQKNISKELFNEFKGSDKLEACDFDGRKGLVFGVVRGEKILMRVVYNY